jgi:hypothetical protein
VEVEGDEEQYIISIKGNGITVERSVPAQVARQMINVIMGGAPPYESVSRPESPVSGRGVDRVAPGVGGRRTSLREFLDETQAKRNPDKITAIAEFLSEHDEVALFTKDDIKGRFRSAGEGAPRNFPRDFAWAVKNGWVAEDHKLPGSFYVTQKGRTAIENKFSTEIRKGTAQPTARRRSRKPGGTSPAEDDAE